MRRIVPIRYIQHAMRARGREYGTHALTLPALSLGRQCACRRRGRQGRFKRLPLLPFSHTLTAAAVYDKSALSLSYSFPMRMCRWVCAGFAM